MPNYHRPQRNQVARLKRWKREATEVLDAWTGKVAMLNVMVSR